MPRGTLLVLGAEPEWLVALAETLSDSDLHVLSGEAETPPLRFDARQGVDLILFREGCARQPGGSPEPGRTARGSWRLVPGHAGDGFPELPQDGFILAEDALRPQEVGRRLQAWLDGDTLITRQREIVRNLSAARRALEADRRDLQRELGRAHERLDCANQELSRRVAELSRLNSDLEHLKELNANIIEALQESLVACDDRGLITHWSRGATELLGWELAEVRGRPLGDFVRAPEAEASLLLDLLRRGEGRKAHCLKLLTQRQEVREVELRAAALRGPAGEIRGTVLLLTDLVKQQRAEEHVRRRDRLASLGELSAGMAHEIRNPLAGIGTTAELLRSRIAVGAPEMEFVDVILEEVGRLEKIIADLLSFARPGKPRPVQGDVHRILDRMVLLLRRQISRRKIQVLRRYDRSLPGVELDPDQTLQLLLNVGLNAVEAMENGGTLTLITQQVTAPDPGSPEGEERSWLRICVRDTGPGVPPEIRDKVFNPFFTTKRRGSGLGLAICQRIVEDQGGTIYLDSSPPQPTTVVIDFPLPAAAAAAKAQTDLFASAQNQPPARELPEDAREAQSAHRG